MLDDISDIAELYNQNPQSEHTRLDRHQLEYELTWRYLERYLPAQGAILEVGAATGRYTVELARRGYTVSAVDLSAAELETCRAALLAAGLDGLVQRHVADARDLRVVTKGDFDAVLLMGPLYHLIEPADRRLALQQAIDRLRPGGLLVSAWISRLGVLGDLIKDNPAWIEDPLEVRSFLAHGRRPNEYPRGGFRGYFALVPEIAPLHEALGLETLTLVGVEPAISADDESYNRLEGAQRRRWLDVLYALGAEPSIIGASRHLLYVGKKPGSSEKPNPQPAA